MRTLTTILLLLITSAFSQVEVINVNSTMTDTKWCRYNVDRIECDVDPFGGAGTAGALTNTNVPKWDTGTGPLGGLVDSIMWETATGIGINDATPVSELQVTGSAQIITSDTTAGTGDNYLRFSRTLGATDMGYVGFGSAGNDHMNIFNDLAADLILGTSGTEQMRIEAGGDVGIGIANPTQKLHVNGVSLHSTAVWTPSYCDETGANCFDASTNFTNTFVNIAGDTMTGALVLPVNGLNVGAGQLQVAGGNVSASGSISAGTTMTAGTGITATTGNIAASSGSVTASATVTAGTTMTAGTGITATTGNIAASSGNITASGSVGAGTSMSAGTTITAGTGLTVTTGNVLVSAGDVRLSGDVWATDYCDEAGGNCFDASTNFTNTFVNIAGDTMTGALVLPVNGLNVGAGQLQVAGGNVSASGSVSAGTTMTAGTGITATTGNIAASSGSVTASATVTAGTSMSAGTTMTAGTGITATTGNIAASSGNISASGTVGAGTSMSAGTTMTAGTGVIATTGNIRATTGDVWATDYCDEAGGNCFDASTNFTNTFVNIAGDTMTGRLSFVNANAGIYNSGGDRVYVEAEGVDHVAEFTSYGLYLPVAGANSLITAGATVMDWAQAGHGLSFRGNSNHPITMGGTAGVDHNNIVLGDGGTVGINGNPHATYPLQVNGEMLVNGGWIRTSGNRGWYNETHGTGMFATSAGTVESYTNSNIETNGTGWFQSNGSTGWRNNTHGGGLYMSDSTWVRLYGGKSFYGGTGVVRTDGELQQGASGLGFRATSSWTRAVSFIYTSDERLKHDVSTYDNALDTTLALRGVNFAWNKDDKEDIGFIAQEVRKVEPTLVIEDDQEMLSVKYGNITAILVEAFKELHEMVLKALDQQDDINANKREIASLREQNDDLIKRLEKLENRK